MNKKVSPEEVRRLIEESKAGGNKANGAWQERLFSGAALQLMTFPSLKFILPGLIPEGATLVVSRPKLGKSWFVLDIAIAVACGRFTLGTLKPATGDVLFLALEDGKRRLQRRLDKLLPTFKEEWPRRLKFATDWPRADQGGLADIENWISSVKAPRLVIVDTLAQFRKLVTSKTQGYADDYAAISDLRRLASKHNIAIVIVHHDRKVEADDVFDTVSGTLGLTAAADTILIMKRQAGSVTLYVRGRDIEESETALQFTKQTCRWTILGAAAEVHRSAERSRVLEALKDGPLQAGDACIAANLRNVNAARQLLFKMVKDGEVIRTGRGLFSLPPSDADNIDNKVTLGGQRVDVKGGNAGITDVITDVTDVTGESRSSVATNGAGPIPTILHRCDYCGGQFGDMNSWNWPPDRPIRQILLHHRCEQPWWDCSGQPEGVR